MENENVYAKSKLISLQEFQNNLAEMRKKRLRTKFKEFISEALEKIYVDNLSNKIFTKKCEFQKEKGQKNENLFLKNQEIKGKLFKNIEDEKHMVKKEEGNINEKSKIKNKNDEKKEIKKTHLIKKMEFDAMKVRDLIEYGEITLDTQRLEQNLLIDESLFKTKAIESLLKSEYSEQDDKERTYRHILSFEANNLKTEELDGIENQDWVDIYTPRKPHYFNRVHFGYEWTKHNLAHYTLDDPPPKDVMGYRFNIFYPNLIDKNVVPKFKIDICENPDFAIIKFIAGAPYEELRFKIVNKEWDFADRKGFKCLFNRGILHLYFDFLRDRWML